MNPVLTINSYLHRGPRPHIEDAVTAVDLGYPLACSDRSYVLCLADGVGGANAGEIASQLACRIAISTAMAASLPVLQGNPGDSSQWDNIPGILIQSCLTAHEAIRVQASRSQGQHGMATTIVLVICLRDRVDFVWSGDSRLYLVRDGEVRPLTRDHSEVQRLLDARLITPNEAECHADRHAIYSCLGMNGEPTVEAGTARLQNGDQLLICSDGLSDVLSANDIARIIDEADKMGLAAQALPQRLVRAALDAGTTDNTSVLIAQASEIPSYLEQIQLTITGLYPVRLAQLLASFDKEKPCFIPMR